MSNFKFYKVSFNFEIPVAVKDGPEAKVDAYYEARSEFPNYNVNEAEIKVEPISEDTYRALNTSVEKLHGKK